MLPRSRNGAWQNKFRQFDRFAKLADTAPQTRASLELAAFTEPARQRSWWRIRTDEQAWPCATPPSRPRCAMPGMNAVLLADVLSTLPNDMLHKVDLTSMAHALEVRTPFLDLRVVEFAFSLPRGSQMQRLRQAHSARDVRSFAAHHGDDPEQKGLRSTPCWTAARTV
jgi:asparagine synthase (glutamine-hydrolysing)